MDEFLKAAIAEAEAGLAEGASRSAPSSSMRVRSSVVGTTAAWELKGTGYFSPVAIACSGVIDAADAENPAWAASWFCLSCDQPRKWSRDDLS